jgi:hypothetical protein
MRYQIGNKINNNDIGYGTVAMETSTLFYNNYFIIIRKDFIRLIDRPNGNG